MYAYICTYFHPYVEGQQCALQLIILLSVLVCTSLFLLRELNFSRVKTHTSVLHKVVMTCIQPLGPWLVA